MLNKKAVVDITWENIIKYLLIAVFAIAMLVFINQKYLKSSQDFFDIETCRLSVLKASLPGSGAEELSDLQGCKTQTPPVIEEIEPEIIHEILAKQLYNCWLMYGKGKVDFLKNTKIDNTCFICSKTDFENNVDDVDRESLRKYIESNNNFKLLPPAENIISADISIKKNKPIYAVIVASKRLNTLNGFIAYFKGDKGLSIGDYNVDNFYSVSFLMQTEDILKQCKAVE